jgi:hypothetical protein
VRSKKAAYKKERETKNAGKNKTRIKLIYVSVCMCDRHCFTTVKKRKEQQQEYNKDKKKKKGQQAKLAIPNVQKICPPA